MIVPATERKPRDVIANAKISDMKRQTLFLFITLFYFSINGYSQACGGGILTLNFYTKNGQKVKNVSFEIFPISKELNEKYKKRSSSIIEDFSEKDIIQSEDLTNELNIFLKVSSMSKSGKFTNSLKFQQAELTYFPIILKISVKTKTIYIYGNYFGGCGGETYLLWDGNSLILR